MYQLFQRIRQIDRWEFKGTYLNLPDAFAAEHLLRQANRECYYTKIEGMGEGNQPRIITKPSYYT